MRVPNIGRTPRPRNSATEGLDPELIAIIDGENTMVRVTRQGPPDPAEREIYERIFGPIEDKEGRGPHV
jgi:hypothetical protein